jgi:zinc/manganese transport system substrate-binding protein
MTSRVPHSSVTLRPHLMPRPTARVVVAFLVALALAVAGAGRAARPAAAADGPSIVATTAVLGSVAQDLVGDAADVTVLMDGSVDPHDWQPSARDIEAVHRADLVVVNGLGLEEGLLRAVAEARAEGVQVFEATDHVVVRETGDGDHEDEHDDGAGDPHFWVDPVSMRLVVDALAVTLAEVGVDVTERHADLAARLDALHEEVAAMVASVPEDQRRLVTGHDSMGYFADRYGFEVVGVVIASLSSQGEVSAREVAELAERIREEGVPAVFTELGTPRAVVDAIAAETGVAVVELPSHEMPADGSYETFIREIARAITSVLS